MTTATAQWNATSSRPFWISLRLGLVALALALAKTGLGLFPEWRRFADATTSWPDFGASPMLTEADATLVSNSAGAWILAAFGFRGSVPYLAGSVILVCIAALLPFLMPVARDARLSPALPRMLFVIVAGGAVAPVLLSWIGSYDALVVIGATVAALSRDRWAGAAGWLIVGLAHSTVAVLALALWLPMAWFTRHDEPRWTRICRLALASGGVLVGWLIMRGIADAWGGSTDRWQLLLRLNRSDVVHAYVAGWPLVLFGALGVAWLLVLRREALSTRPGRVLLIEAVIAALVIPLIAVDETRITVLCLAATTFTWAASAATARGADSVIETNWRIYGLAAAVIPVVVVWQGAVLYPGWDLAATWQAVGFTP